jgi:hypothetical protein
MLEYLPAQHDVELPRERRPTYSQSGGRCSDGKVGPAPGPDVEHMHTRLQEWTGPRVEQLAFRTRVARRQLTAIRRFGRLPDRGSYHCSIRARPTTLATEHTWKMMSHHSDHGSINWGEASSTGYGPAAPCGVALHLVCNLPNNYGDPDLA